MVPEGFVRSEASLVDHGVSSGASCEVSQKAQEMPAEEPKAHVQLQTDSPVAILTNHTLSQVQKTLALKILKAVGINTPSIVEINFMNSDMMDILEQSVPARWFVYFEEHFEKFYGTVEKLKSSHVLYTFSLDYMLEGDGQEIQTYKRQVWNHMKLFSKRWEAWS